MHGYKMQTTYLLVVVFAVVVQQTFADDFPDFIKRCTVSDPKFDDCVLTSANSFLSTVAKGGTDKFSLLPLPVMNLTKTYNFTEKFSLKFTKLISHSDEGLVITSIHFDFNEKTLTFSAKCFKVLDTFNYTASGEILGKPVLESGKVNTTFDELELNATVTLDFKTKNDKKYLEAVSCKLTMDDKNFMAKSWAKCGDPMTEEQKKEYESYMEKLHEMVKSEPRNDIVEALNTLFGMLPYDEMFLQ